MRYYIQLYQNKKEHQRSMKIFRRLVFNLLEDGFSQNLCCKFCQNILPTQYWLITNKRVAVRKLHKSENNGIRNFSMLAGVEHCHTCVLFVLQGSLSPSSSYAQIQLKSQQQNSQIVQNSPSFYLKQNLHYLRWVKKGNCKSRTFTT